MENEEQVTLDGKKKWHLSITDGGIFSTSCKERKKRGIIKTTLCSEQCEKHCKYNADSFCSIYGLEFNKGFHISADKKSLF